MSPNVYTIQELCEQSGFPRRTIHFYSQQGIIPPPSGAGLAATYDDQHLLRLRLVPVLRQQGLRLDEIRIRLNQTPVSELSRLLDQLNIAQPSHRKSLPRPEPFIRYTLPAGIELNAPANLSPSNRASLEQLLQAAQHLFNQEN